MKKPNLLFFLIIIFTFLSILLYFLISRTTKNKAYRPEDVFCFSGEDGSNNVSFDTVDDKKWEVSSVVEKYVLNIVFLEDVKATVFTKSSNRDISVDSKNIVIVVSPYKMSGVTSSTVYLEPNFTERYAMGVMACKTTVDVTKNNNFLKDFISKQNLQKPYKILYVTNDTMDELFLSR